MNASIHPQPQPQIYPQDQIEQIKDKIDPLAIFGLKDKSRQEVIDFLSGPRFTETYRALMRQHHPDRGGSVLKSSIVNYAYNKLNEARQNILQYAHHVERDVNELRQGFHSQSQSSQPSQQQTAKRDEKEVQAAVHKMMKASPDQFQKQFNEAFTLSKLHDYTDDGYELDDKERTSSTKRANIQVKRQAGVNSSNINEAFERTAKVNTALIVRDNRQPEGISSLKYAVYEYGKKKEDDFGRMTGGASDYRIAFGGERLVDPNSAAPKDKVMTGKVTMDMAKQARSVQNIDPEMTPEERERWAEEQEEREQMEEERKANIVEMDYQMNQRSNIFIERMLTFAQNQ